MNHLSLIAGLAILSASPLFAQAAASDSATTTAPTPVVSATTPALVTATTPELAKPSPEFRSYVRLWFSNLLTEFAANTELLSYLVDVGKGYDAKAQNHGNLMLAQIVIKALNSTSSSALMGKEKAFVDEVAQLLLEFYAGCKSMSMNDKVARDSMEEKLLIPMMQLCQKHPSVAAYFSSLELANNFGDVEKLMQSMLLAMSNTDELNRDERIQLLKKTFSQLAEMIRSNEV